MSPVVMSVGRQGEQLVIARIEGKYHITVCCPNCGNVQQEIDPAVPLKAGDWVRTKDGHEGKILLVTRLTAFIEIEGHDEMRTKPFLLSELAKVEIAK